MFGINRTFGSYRLFGEWIDLTPPAPTGKYKVDPHACLVISEGPDPYACVVISEGVDPYAAVLID